MAIPRPHFQSAERAIRNDQRPVAPAPLGGIGHARQVVCHLDLDEEGVAGRIGGRRIAAGILTADEGDGSHVAAGIQGWQLHNISRVGQPSDNGRGGRRVAAGRGCRLDGRRGWRRTDERILANHQRQRDSDGRGPDGSGGREKRGEPRGAPLRRIGQCGLHGGDEVQRRIEAAAGAQILGDLVVVHDATSGSTALVSGSIARRSTASPALSRDFAVPTRTSRAAATARPGGEFTGLDVQLAAAADEVGDGGHINLRDATDFEWDEAHIFGAYNTPEMVADQMDGWTPLSPVGRWLVPDIFFLSNDGHQLVAFRQGGEVVAWTVMNQKQLTQSYIEFDPRVLPRTAATSDRFEVRRFSEGGELVPADSADNT